MIKTIVLGLGNLVHCDDGAGVHAIHALQRDDRVPPGTTLIDGGTQGLALLPHISNACRLLVIDAVDTAEIPGTVMRFEGKALRGLPGKASVHQLGFADMMAAMSLLGDSPAEMVVLGVQPKSTEWSTALTEPVEQALPQLLNCVIAQLRAWEAV